MPAMVRTEVPAGVLQIMLGTPVLQKGEGMLSSKVYVDVVVYFTREGQVRPLSFLWEDGSRYEIDKIKSIKRAASMKAGGRGVLYKCMIRGRESNLYYEGNNKWFMERNAG